MDGELERSKTIDGLYAPVERRNDSEQRMGAEAGAGTQGTVGKGGRVSTAGKQPRGGIKRGRGGGGEPGGDGSESDDWDVPDLDEYFSQWALPPESVVKICRAYANNLARGIRTREELKRRLEYEGYE